MASGKTNKGVQIGMNVMLLCKSCVCVAVVVIVILYEVRDFLTDCFFANAMVRHYEALWRLLPSSTRGYVGTLMLGKIVLKDAVGKGAVQVVKNHPDWPRPYNGITAIRHAD